MTERKMLFDSTSIFRLASGQLSNFKIDCDCLTGNDLKSLSEIVIAKLKPYGKVIGVPTGGLPFASFMKSYIDETSDNILIVDDVFTTGSSINKLIAKENLDLELCQGLVIFARNPPPDWITPIFTLNPVFSSMLRVT